MTGRGGLSNSLNNYFYKHSLAKIKSTKKLIIARATLLVALGSTGCHRRPEVPILGYHSVVDDPGRLDVTPKLFAAQLDALAAAGFHTVSLHAVLEHQDRGAPLPARPIVLTFDDGTADEVATLLPALKARGMIATFFVVSDWLGADAAHRKLEPQSRGSPARAALTWPELKLLRDAGMEIGSHSRTHARLADLTDAAALEELTASKRALEAGLGAPIELFAYPYNSVRARLEPLVRQAGYRAAVAGQEHGGRGRDALYRIGVYRDTTPAELVSFALAGSR